MGSLVRTKSSFNIVDVGHVLRVYLEGFSFSRAAQVSIIYLGVFGHGSGRRCIANRSIATSRDADAPKISVIPVD